MIHPRLLLGIEEILSASFDALRDPICLAAIMRETGLSAGPWLDPGIDSMHCYDRLGLMQGAQEMAEFLALVSAYPIRTALDIGTFNGWATAIMTAYLWRWNPCVRVVSIDPSAWGSESEKSALARMLPVTFRRGTSQDLRGKRFDLCFIDADHAYAAIRADYEAVGQWATICAFHDIVESRTTSAQPEVNGVPRFWHELKATPGRWSRCQEIRQCGRPFLGIGVEIRAQVSLGTPG